MKKLILVFFSCVSVFTVKTQVTYTLPDVIPEYNGTVESFGQNHLYYPSAGEIRLANEAEADAFDVVAYYTRFQYPAKYLLHNTSLSFVFNRKDSVSGALV